MFAEKYQRAAQTSWFGHRKLKDPDGLVLEIVFNSAKAIASADGLDPLELETLRARMAATLTPPAVAKRVCDFDVALWTPQSLLQALPGTGLESKDLCALVLYEGLSVSNSDGTLSEAEVRSAKDASVALGVDGGVVDALVDLVKRDHALRAMRIEALMGADFNFAYTTSPANFEEESLQLLQFYMFGHRNIPKDQDFMLAFQAAKCIAGADGLDELEEEALLGRMAVTGCPIDVAEKVLAFDQASTTAANMFAGIEIPDHIKPITAGYLLYEGLSVSMADSELHEDELAAANEVAKSMGVTKDTVDKMAALVKEEFDTRAKRIEVLPRSIDGERSE